MDCCDAGNGNNGSDAVVSINLGNNGLSGLFVPDISRMLPLTSLTLIWNELTGTVPYILGDLVNLRKIKDTAASS